MLEAQQDRGTRPRRALQPKAAPYGAQRIARGTAHHGAGTAQQQARHSAGENRDVPPHSPEWLHAQAPPSP